MGGPKIWIFFRGPRPWPGRPSPRDGSVRREGEREKSVSRVVQAWSHNSPTGISLLLPRERERERGVYVECYKLSHIIRLPRVPLPNHELTNFSKNRVKFANFKFWDREFKFGNSQILDKAKNCFHKNRDSYFPILLGALTMKKLSNQWSWIGNPIQKLPKPRSQRWQYLSSCFLNAIGCTLLPLLPYADS